MNLFNTFFGLLTRFDYSNNFQPRWYAIFFKPLYIARRALFVSIYKFAKTIQRKRILDVGCGEAPYRALFRNCEYIGIDVAGASHDDSIKRADVYFNGLDIPFPDASFDVVICTEVLEHVPNAEKIVSEISRVLKKSGTLYLTIPFAWDEHAIPYDFRRLTTFGLRKILLEHELSVISIQKTTGFFGTVGQLASSFLFDVVSKTLKLPYRLKYILQKLFLLMFCFPIQAVSLFLDYMFEKRGIATGYIVIANKEI